jgi:hypothetical protein
MMQPTWESGEVLQPQAEASGPWRRSTRIFGCLRPQKQTYSFVHCIDMLLLPALLVRTAGGAAALDPVRLPSSPESLSACGSTTLGKTKAAMQDLLRVTLFTRGIV